MVTTFLVLGAGEDVGKVLIGARGMGEGLVEHLRDLKKFWGVSFKIKEVEGAEGGLMLAAVGIGYSNTAKKTLVSRVLSVFFCWRFVDVVKEC